MPATFAWYLALRYLVTRWVNVLGTIGVAVAVWALIVVVAVMSGFIEEMTDNVHHASPDLLLTDLQPNTTDSQVRPLLEADPDVVHVAPRLTHYAILFPHGLKVSGPTDPMHERPTTSQNYVQLWGVDYEQESKTTGFKNWLADVPEGRVPRWAPQAFQYSATDLKNPFRLPQKAMRERLGRSPLRRLVKQDPQTGMADVRDLDGIILGLHQLHSPEKMILPGQAIEVVSARFEQVGDAQQLLKIKRPFHLSGAFYSKSPFMDDLVAFLDIDVLREMLGRDEFDDDYDLVTDFAIKVRPEANLTVVRDRLKAAVSSFGGDVRTWEEQNQRLLNAIRLERGMMKVALFVVMLVAAFLIYATLNMMVTQKIKDIGILTSLGATPGGISAIFLVSGAVIGFVGCGLGLAAGWTTTVNLNGINDFTEEHFGWEIFPHQIFYLPQIPYRLEWDWIGQVLLAAFALAVFVALFPARKAGRLPPMEALKYE